MRAVSVLLMAYLLSAAIAQESPDSINVKINTVDTKPSVRLDPYIRKALLKALTELEENDKQSTESENIEGSTVDSYTNSELLRTGDDFTESMPTEPTKQGIQIHSFVVNGQGAFANVSHSNPTFIDNNISILGTTAGNVENQVTATLPTQTAFNEIFQAKETGNLQQIRSIPQSSVINDIVDNKQVSSTPATPATTTTTTTTTPKPTHNNDGENIEEVDKRDVQVFQAPLVAAFTVHQDAQGLPKKVVPILQGQPARNQEVVRPLISSPLQSLAQASFNQEVPKPHKFNVNSNVNNNPQPNFVSQQIELQQQLEEKQRILEEQLRLLQFQQKQQEELLRKQQFLLQQKEAQRHQEVLYEQERLKNQQLFLEQQRLSEQQRLQSNQVVNNFPLPNSHAKFQNQFPFQNNAFRQSNSQISIQPSVSLDQPNNIITNHQQLPNREAVDFLIHLRQQQSQQFPLQENHLPQGIGNFLQPGLAANFHQGPNFNALAEQYRQKQGNRVFRQESGVANPGFNNQNFNRFNTFSPNYNNRFFPFNRQFGNNNDVELKQLLVQSGLSGRSHEDLNIVSKVLSLNHGIPINSNISNRLPFDRRRQVRAPL